MSTVDKNRLQSIISTDIRLFATSKLVVSIALVQALVIATVAIGATNVGTASPNTGHYVSTIGFMFGVVLPPLCLYLGWTAVKNEDRYHPTNAEYPQSIVRTGVVIGHGILLAITALFGFLVGGLITLTLFESIALPLYAWAMVLTVFFMLSYFSIGYTIATCIDSRRFGIVLLVSTYLLFTIGWTLVVRTLGNSFQYVASVPTVAGFDRINAPNSDFIIGLLGQLEPSIAYQLGITAVSNTPPIGTSLSYIGATAGPLQQYLGPWTGVVILVGWVIVPLLAIRYINRT